jgi:hypothetical protein
VISVGILYTSTSLTSGQICLGGGQSYVLNKPTSGVSLGAVLRASPSPIHNRIPTNITITFLTLGLTKKGGMLQPHVDYDVTIPKGW